jgi:hypothetical protein
MLETGDADVARVADRNGNARHLFVPLVGKENRRVEALTCPTLSPRNVYECHASPPAVSYRSRLSTGDIRHIPPDT